MITRADVIEQVREWGLTEEVIEKDYVLGWLLWGIGSDPALARTWVFKGGTCPPGATIRCYSFDELFAEKIRAMAQRERPRDLYDIVNLFRRNDLRRYPDAIRSALTEKCTAKSMAVPAAADFVGSPLLIELESEWSNMPRTAREPPAWRGGPSTVWLPKRRRHAGRPR